MDEHDPIRGEIARKVANGAIFDAEESPLHYWPVEHSTQEGPRPEKFLDKEWLEEVLIPQLIAGGCNDLEFPLNSAAQPPQLPNEWLTEHGWFVHYSCGSGSTLKRNQSRTGAGWQWRAMPNRYTFFFSPRLKNDADKPLSELSIMHTAGENTIEYSGLFDERATTNTCFAAFLDVCAAT